MAKNKKSLHKLERFLKRKFLTIATGGGSAGIGGGGLLGKHPLGHSQGRLMDGRPHRNRATASASSSAIAENCAASSRTVVAEEEEESSEEEEESCSRLLVTLGTPLAPVGESSVTPADEVEVKSEPQHQLQQPQKQPAVIEMKEGTSSSRKRPAATAGASSKTSEGGALSTARTLRQSTTTTSSSHSTTTTTTTWDNASWSQLTPQQQRALQNFLDAPTNDRWKDLVRSIRHENKRRWKQQQQQERSRMNAEEVESYLLSRYNRSKYNNQDNDDNCMSEEEEDEDNGRPPIAQVITNNPSSYSSKTKKNISDTTRATVSTTEDEDDLMRCDFLESASSTASSEEPSIHEEFLASFTEIRKMLDDNTRRSRSILRRHLIEEEVVVIPPQPSPPLEEDTTTTTTTERRREERLFVTASNTSAFVAVEPTDCTSSSHCENNNSTIGQVDTSFANRTRMTVGIANDSHGSNDGDAFPEGHEANENVTYQSRSVLVNVIATDEKAATITKNQTSTNSERNNSDSNTATNNNTVQISFATTATNYCKTILSDTKQLFPFVLPTALAYTLFQLPRAFIVVILLGIPTVLLVTIIGYDWEEKEDEQLRRRRRRDSSNSRQAAR